MKKLIIALALLPATSMLVLANSAHAAEACPAPPRTTGEGSQTSI